MGAKSSKSGESRPAARDEGKFYGNVSEFWFLIDKVNVTKLPSAKHLYDKVKEMLPIYVRSQIIGADLDSVHTIQSSEGRTVQGMVYCKDFKSAQDASLKINSTILGGLTVNTTCIPVESENDIMETGKSIEINVQNRNSEQEIPEIKKWHEHQRMGTTHISEDKRKEKTLATTTKTRMCPDARMVSSDQHAKGTGILYSSTNSFSQLGGSVVDPLQNKPVGQYKDVVKAPTHHPIMTTSADQQQSFPKQNVLQSSSLSENRKDSLQNLPSRLRGTNYSPEVNCHPVRSSFSSSASSSKTYHNDECYPQNPSKQDDMSSNKGTAKETEKSQQQQKQNVKESSSSSENRKEYLQRVDTCVSLSSENDLSEIRSSNEVRDGERRTRQEQERVQQQQDGSVPEGESHLLKNKECPNLQGTFPSRERIYDSNKKESRTADFALKDECFTLDFVSKNSENHHVESNNYCEKEKLDKSWSQLMAHDKKIKDDGISFASGDLENRNTACSDGTESQSNSELFNSEMGDSTESKGKKQRSKHKFVVKLYKLPPSFNRKELNDLFRGKYKGFKFAFLTKQEGGAVAVFSSAEEASQCAVKMKNLTILNSKINVQVNITTEKGLPLSDILPAESGERVKDWLDQSEDAFSDDTPSLHIVSTEENDGRRLSFNSTEEQECVVSPTDVELVISDVNRTPQSEATFVVFVTNIPCQVSDKKLYVCFNKKCRGVKKAYRTKPFRGEIVFNTQEEMELCIKEMDKTIPFGDRTIRIRRKKGGLISESEMPKVIYGAQTSLSCSISSSESHQSQSQSSQDDISNNDAHDEVFSANSNRSVEKIPQAKKKPKTKRKESASESERVKTEPKEKERSTGDGNSFTVKLHNIPPSTSSMEIEGFIATQCKDVTISKLVKADDGVYIVKMKTYDDCETVYNTLRRKIFNGATIRTTMTHQTTMKTDVKEPYVVVSNLNPKFDEKAVRTSFSGCQGVTRVEKPNHTSPRVYFESVDLAVNAVKVMDGFVVEGNKKLKVKLGIETLHEVQKNEFGDQLLKYTEELENRSAKLLTSNTDKLKNLKEKLTELEQKPRPKKRSLDDFERYKQERETYEQKQEEAQNQRERFESKYKELFDRLLDDAPGIKKVIAKHKKAFNREFRRFEASLPIYAKRMEVIETLRKNQVLVLIGETGSGKSTQLAQYVADELFSKPGSIVVTQPRKIAAVSLAKRVAEEYGCAVGEEVGHHVGLSQNTNRRKTIIKFVTDRILLNEVIKETESMGGYSCIIVDEAHERSIYTDLLLAMIKKNLPKYPDLRLIVTSATLNTDVFRRYFDGCPVVKVQGRAFPVEPVFAKVRPSDYLDGVVEKAVEVCTSSEGGDILIFLTQQNEIEKTCERLKKRLGEGSNVILPLHGKLQAEDQEIVFKPTPRGERKIVVATNSAETSITIDGIRIVIDSGMVKEPSFDPTRNMTTLDVKMVSRSSAMQRRGRAGRTAPGKCYCMYTNDDFQEMEQNTQPEILKMNLGMAVLQLLSLGVTDILEFDYVEAPSPETLITAQDSLKQLGAVNRDGTLTDLGKQMLELPTVPKLSKALLEGIERGCGGDIIVVAALMSGGRDVFYRGDTAEKKHASAIQKQEFCTTSGDLLSALEVYKLWLNVPEKKQNKWCMDHALNAKTLRVTRETIKEIQHILRKMKINYQLKAKSENLKQDLVKSLLEGYSENIAWSLGHEKVGYRVVQTPNQRAKIHPSSVLSSLGSQPPWIFFQEMRRTSETFLLNVTPIEKEWLAEVAMHMLQFVDEHEIRRCQAVRERIRPLGPALVKSLIGAKGSTLRGIEDSVLEYAEEYPHAPSSTGTTQRTVFCSIDCNVDQGFVDIYTPEDCLDYAKRKVNDVIESKRRDILHGTTEKVISKVGDLRALVGNDMKTASILEPGEYCKLNVFVEPSDESVKVDAMEVLRSLEDAGDVIHSVALAQNSERQRLSKRLKPDETRQRSLPDETLPDETLPDGTRQRSLHDETLSDGTRQRSLPDETRQRFSNYRWGTVTYGCSAGEARKLMEHNFKAVLPSNVKEIKLKPFQLTAKQPYVPAYTGARIIVTWYPFPSTGSAYIKCRSKEVAGELCSKLKASINELTGDIKMEITRFDDESTVAKKIDASGCQSDTKITVPSYLAGKSVRIEEEKRKLFKVLSKFGKIHIVNTIARCYKIIANVVFVNFEDAMKAIEELDGTTGELGARAVYIEPEGTSEISCDKRLYGRIKQTVKKLEEHEDVKLKVEDVQRSRNMKITVTGDNGEVVQKVGAQIADIMAAKSITMEDPVLARRLSTGYGGNKLKEIQKESGAFIQSSIISGSIQITGPPEAKEQALRQVNDLIKQLTQNKNLEISLRGSDTPVGTIREVLKQFGKDLEELVKEGEECQVEMNIRRRKLIVSGSDVGVKNVRARFEAFLTELRRLSKHKHCVSEENEECPVCFDEVDEPYRLNVCGHCYCSACISQYVTSTLDSLRSADMFPLKCLYDGCKYPLTKDDFLAVLKKDQMEQFYQVSLESFVIDSDRYKPCPSPNCCWIYKSTSKPKIFSCPECNQGLCQGCGDVPHELYDTCAAYKATKDPTRAGELYKKWISGADTRECPKCAVMIEKNKGCSHVHCTQCKVHICWKCGKYFKTSQSCYDHIEDCRR